MGLCWRGRIAVIYWARHCQETGQEPDAPLTQEGHQQARRLAKFVREYGIERIVSSPYLRAIQSIQPFAKLSGCKIETDARLRERVLSPSPVPDWKDALRKSFDDQNYSLRGGETARTAGDRAEAVFNECIWRRRTTIVVSHGYLTILLLIRLGRAISFEASLRLTNPDLFRIQVSESAYEITRLWDDIAE
jgi:2,3-bisphosphoglycerate-dependent phosphoglycerate mutase